MVAPEDMLRRAAFDEQLVPRLLDGLAAANHDDPTAVVIRLEVRVVVDTCSILGPHGMGVLRRTALRIEPTMPYVLQ